jgi:hypothetical protein
VQVRKLESTDAFYVLDLDGAARSVGVVRVAPKVLVDGAELLARATTYSFALFSVQAGGVSAGVNAKPDVAADAVAAFTAEVAAVSELTFFAGTGVPAGAVPSADEELLARGAVSAASAFGSGTAGVAGPMADGWAERLGGLWPGTWLGAGGVDAQADVLFLAGRAGIVDDDAAGGVTAKVLVPVTPVPVTAKAYATLNRAGATFVPDTLSCAAPLLAVADADGGDPVERVGRIAAELAAEEGEPWRNAVARAETFLATWQDTLPYGRPLA